MVSQHCCGYLVGSVRDKIAGIKNLSGRSKAFICLQDNLVKNILEEPQTVHVVILSEC